MNYYTTADGTLILGNTISLCNLIDTIRLDNCRYPEDEEELIHLDYDNINKEYKPIKTTQNEKYNTNTRNIYPDCL